MSGMVLKIIATIAILMCGLVGGYFALFLKAKSSWHYGLIYGDYFARGIFLGAGLVHLLPDAVENSQSLMAPLHYPLMFAIVALTVYLLTALESSLHSIQHRIVVPTQSYLAYLLLLLLSIHSFLEGLAMGFNNEVATIAIIFIAIIAHKAAGTFALGNQLNKTLLAISLQKKMIFFLACMTPMAILLGASIDHCLRLTNQNLAQSTFNAIAAGTFLYLANHKDEHHVEGSSFYSMIYFGIGLGVMLVVAIWI